VPLNVTVLLSGGGTTFAAIAAFCQSTDSDYRIAHVISDQAKAYGLERAAALNIATTTIPYTDYPNRQQFDEALLAAVSSTEPDLVVLAGFMRIVDATFVHAFTGKLLNIHPSLLPKYPGLNTYARALQAEETIHGSTVHFVNDVLDGGPPIIQVIVNIEENDTVESLSARVQAAERKLYPTVINWFAQERLQLSDSYVVFNGHELTAPLQVPWKPTTGEIDFENTCLH